MRIDPAPPRANVRSALQLEQLAFERRQDAFARARQLLTNRAPDHPVKESLRQAWAADEQWRSAIAEVKRQCWDALHGK